MVDVWYRERWSEFLWRTWGSLGVSAWDRRGPAAAIDPEALIILTEAHGDVRLQHEVLDWGTQHAHLLAPARLRMLATRHASARPRVDAWIATVAAHTRKARWRPTPDLVLADFTPSGKSRGYGDLELDSGVSMTLRFRALTGTGARGEVIRAMHPVVLGIEPPLTSREIADRAGATTSQVRSTLDELTAARLLTATGGARSRRYAPRRNDPLGDFTWRIWIETPYGPWHEALALLPALGQLLALEHEHPDDPPLARRVAHALDTFAGVVPLIHKLGVSIPGQPSGAVRTVATDLVEVADRSLRALLDQLDSGTPHSMPAPRDAVVWGPPTWTHPWQGTSTRRPLHDS